MAKAELLFCFLVVVLQAIGVEAKNDTCPLEWIFIDIHYRPVDARPNTFSYGLFIGAGVNSQNQSLWPAIGHNETTFASNDFCGSDSPQNCEDPAFTHGHFGADSSASWKDTPQYMPLDANDAVNAGVNVSYGTETLNLFTHFMDPSPPFVNTVPEHPVTLMSDYQSQRDIFFNSGSIGLGPSSTLLKQLVDLGKIGRSVVGLYLGTRYPRAGGIYNGSIVLGGYDAGRLMDDDIHKYAQVTTPSDYASPFRVHVKQMSLGLSDGSNIGLITNDGFDGYISTNQYAVEFPSAIVSSLASAMNASPTDDDENVLQLAQGFDGNLTITLDDGYEIIYPSEWISNVSNRSPISAKALDSSNETSSTSPFIFGTAFLHHLYMTIDYDDKSFSLAKAKVADNYVMPRSLCPNKLPLAIGKPNINKFTQTGMIGAIIGGIIGGIGLLWFVLFFLRKYYQRKQSREGLSKMENGGAAGPKKSSLRKKTKRGLVRFVRPKETKAMQTGNPKRVSFTDSDSSSDNGIKITVIDKGPQIEQNIEMRTVRHTDAPPVYSPVSPLNPSDFPQPDTNGLAPQTRQTTVNAPLPAPDRFNDPYASSPLATPMETPRTGNPLLGNNRGFLEHDDDDDSDLEPQYRRTHSRTPSEQHRRTQLGLKIDTAVSAGSRAGPVIGAARSLQGRPKPAPLPVHTTASSQRRTGADQGKANPMRALFGKAGSGTSGKPGALRKMFPPPP